jgi:hypothetical protein
MKSTGRIAVPAAVVLVVLLLSAGCAIRLGGPKPEAYNATGMRAGTAESASEVAGRIRSANADLVLMSAPRDSAWFADVATQSGLALTRPGHTGPSTLALMTRLEVLGDTALILPVGAGGATSRLHIKDALYKIDKDRSLDLMLVSFAEAGSVHESVRALLNYIATDVNGTSAVILGVDAPNREVADSVGLLVRAAFPSVLTCGENPPVAPPPGLSIDLYYGPEARLSCESAHIVAAPSPTVVARVLVER